MHASMYWTERITEERGNSTKLWQSLSKILRRDDTSKTTGSTKHTADNFIQFFEKKVESVRASTAHCPPPPAPSQPAVNSTLTELLLCSEEDMRRVIVASPTKSCTLDPIPTFLLKESLDVLLMYVTAMVNASLRDGCLPTSQKTAIITPLLKKPSLDAGHLKSFRPVSNLTFMSKVVERIVTGQLVQYLQSNGLMPRLQSAYRRHHSTAVSYTHLTLPTILRV